MAHEGKQRVYRCKDEVVRGLLQRELNGLSLCTSALRVQDLPLYVAAIRTFGFWGDALRAAGIDPESVSGRRVWSAERVLRRIRELEREGVAINAQSVRKIDQGTIQAARRFWGSWDNALRAAGFDPSSVRGIRPKWKRSTIIEAIRAHVAKGGRVTWNRAPWSAPS